MFSCWGFTILVLLSLLIAVGYLATVPAAAVLCWMLFGIEDIGHQIEQPFSHSDENTFDTSIPVDTLAAGIVRHAADEGCVIAALRLLRSCVLFQPAHSRQFESGRGWARLSLILRSLPPEMPQ